MKYKVKMQSRPGFYAQYGGYVTVYANNEEEAVDAAFRELKRGAFPDRGRSMWRVEEVKRAWD